MKHNWKLAYGPIAVPALTGYEGSRENPAGPTATAGPFPLSRVVAVTEHAVSGVRVGGLCQVHMYTQEKPGDKAEVRGESWTLSIFVFPPWSAAPGFWLGRQVEEHLCPSPRLRAGSPGPQHLCSDERNGHFCSLRDLGSPTVEDSERERRWQERALWHHATEPSTPFCSP